MSGRDASGGDGGEVSLPGRAPSGSDLRAMLPDELAAAVAALGERPFRAKQLFRGLHARAALRLEEITDLPRAFVERLHGAHALSEIAIDRVEVSRDGTRKYRLRTSDDQAIEAVYMPEEKRKTLCVSSQVGCALGCGFCLTATMGLRRHLTAGEIVAQVAAVVRDLIAAGMPGPRPLSNLVFMGMGEPLHNFDPLVRALRLLLHPDGLDFSHRHVTVSTAGLVPEIRRLGEETNVKLAVSLNATTDALRDELMPINRRYPIAELLAAVRDFPQKIGRRVTLEYVLLGGVNDAVEDADRLAQLVQGLPAKVNLIPYNENPGLGFASPGDGRVVAFQERLIAAGVTVTVRKNRGRDISAACGQLAVALPPRAPRTSALPIASH